MDDLTNSSVSNSIVPELNHEETMDDSVNNLVAPAFESKESIDDFVNWDSPQIDSVFENSINRLIPEDLGEPVVEEKKEVTKIRNAIMPKEVGNILGLVGTTQVAKRVEEIKSGLLSQSTIDNLGNIIHTVYTDKVRDNENIFPSLETMASTALSVNEVSERSDDLLSAYKRKLSNRGKAQEFDGLNDFEQQVHDISRGIGR